MSEVKILGEFYFSQILNKPILDAQGRRVGRVRDMVMRWDSLAPHVTGIKTAKGAQAVIPIELVSFMNHREIRLSVDFSSNITVPLQEDETFIGKWLLDKQIIDLEGSKLVRVNDLTLSWITRNHKQIMVLVAVDIGLRGVFRRLGVEFLVRRVKNNFLGWQYIKPLESRSSALQITREKEQLRELHPADIADLLETMGY
ncbi:PRC-barrel domain-containing protein [Desulfitobacterium metallireducens]|uniref:PRC-barrel domain-containing protein n=1 Tax=Desulfitobacterium metallireducens TaxID=142877 RepID=UPI000231369B|nr:PRC-barrel domain-containing protein [Desulfitobacterium metallireducens]